MARPSTTGMSVKHMLNVREDPIAVSSDKVPFRFSIGDTSSSLLALLEYPCNNVLC